MRIGSLRTMSVTPLAGITQGECKNSEFAPNLPCPLFEDCTWSPTMGRGLTERRGLTQMLRGQKGVRLKSKAHNL